jgi:hypothetical protein
VTLNRQFTDDFQILAGYTYSKTIDDGSFDSEQPQIHSRCETKEHYLFRIRGIDSR